jgi:hypothetical protein
MNENPRQRVAALAVVLVCAFAPPGWAQSPKAADPSAAELLFWETIRNSTNPADFEEYLRQYPNGKFAGLARIRVQPKPATAPASVATPAPSAAKVAFAPTLAIGLPQAGATWKYRYTDRKYSLGGRHVFSVRLDSVNGPVMNETLSPEGATSAQATRTALASEALRFTVRLLPQTRTVVEFAPYLNFPEPRLAAPIRVKSGSGYPVGGSAASDWQVTMAALPESQVTVPAGTFRASRVELKGTRSVPNAMALARFQVTMSYAPEVKRYVRIEHRAWNGGSTLAADELVELLEFSGVASQ